MFSVPVLAEGCFLSKDKVISYLGRSNYITNEHIEHLCSESKELGLDTERQCRETDASDLMEGIYIKVEENGFVADRMKYVRASFLQTVEMSESHWLERPIVPNLIKR